LPPSQITCPAKLGIESVQTNAPGAAVVDVTE
jgi:uncharacterized protein YegP (UPF0339 family)